MALKSMLNFVSRGGQNWADAYAVEEEQREVPNFESEEPKSFQQFRDAEPSEPSEPSETSSHVGTATTSNFGGTDDDVESRQSSTGLTDDMEGLNLGTSELADHGNSGFQAEGTPELADPGNSGNSGFQAEGTPGNTDPGNSGFQAEGTPGNADSGEEADNEGALFQSCGVGIGITGINKKVLGV